LQYRLLLNVEMKATYLLVALFCFYSCSSALEYGLCVFRGTNNDANVTGTITFVTNGDMVDMTVNIQGITQNPDIAHGIHVHQWGDLSNYTSAASAGGHFDISGKSHGCENTTDRQTGDTGNWQATGGVISGSKSLDLMGLTGNNSIIGRAVILHQLTDDCGTVNLGNAGTRLAFCVIGVGNPASQTGTTNDAVAGIPTTTRAVCELKPTNGNSVSGRVWFEQDSPSGATTVKAKIDGITGYHGFHIHAWGDLSYNNGTYAGGHFNPTAVNHGIPPTTTRHVGDMGNIYYYSSNIAYYQYANDAITLTGTNNVIGHAVIVHAAFDDCTNPVGAAGARLAQCVIGIADPAAYNPVAAGFPASGVETTQNNTACSLSSTSTSATGTAATATSTTGDESAAGFLAANSLFVLAAMFWSFWN